MDYEKHQLLKNQFEPDTYGGTTETGDGSREPVTLTWDKINVFAPQESGACDCFKKEVDTASKQILKDVSGIVTPGTLLAIMGASGSGKTTLLNVLTARSGSRLEVQGDVRVNGKALGTNIKYLSAYVQQDDLFISTMTVREHLWFQAHLRIEQDVSEAVRKQRIDDVMTELSLYPLADNRIGNPGQDKALSGGERKRLSFASEVLTNPALMFCDEPTSGLDSYMAQTVIETLRDMASRGRTILCTIHQPSSAVYAMMDKLLVMAEGRVAYIGDTENVLKFFESVGYPCPANYNPADFFIHQLAIIPGQEEQCRAVVKKVCDTYERSSVHEETMAAIKQASKEDYFVMEMDNVKDVYSKENKTKKYEEISYDYKASWWKQFKVLFTRAWKDNARNPAVNRARIIQICFMSLIICFIWFNQMYDQKGIQNIDGALFLMQLQLTYGNVYTVANSFPGEYPLFSREHRNAIYRVDTYFLTHVLAELPVFLLIPTIMSVSVYFVVGLYTSVEAFFTFWAVLVLVSVVTMACGHLITTLTADVTLALAMIPAIISPMQFFGGFFLNTATIPWYMKPLQWISWFSYSNEILVINQWKDVNSIECEYEEPEIVWVRNYTSHQETRAVIGYDTSMCYNDGQAVIDNLSFSEAHVPTDFIMLSVLAVLFEMLAFLLLWIRSKRK